MSAPGAFLRIAGRQRLAGGFSSKCRAVNLRPARVSLPFSTRRWGSTESDKTKSSTETESTTPKPPSQIQLTAEKYPEIKRDAQYAQLTADDVQYFRSVLGSENAVMDGLSKDISDDLEPFNVDWMRKYKGQSRLVLKPKTAEDVSKILKYCNDRKLAVVPQGGNTGLVGGGVPVFDEIVLSLNSMNKIRSFDPTSGILVADAGVILETADKFLAEQGYIFPLDLGAKGTCHIGGNVACNAGGLRLLRYGSLHGTVLGIEAVLPDGTIFNDLSKLRKNNTGFDLKQLFIGSEGTIGVITAISIVCPKRSSAVNVAYFGLPSYEHVLKAFVKAKTELGEILSAFEMMDGAAQNLVAETTGKKRPLEDEHPFYVLIETSGSNKEHDDAKLEAFLEGMMEEEICSDGTLAMDETQLQNLWSWREGIPEATKHFGGVYRYDVSIPLPKLYDLVLDTRKRLEADGLMGKPDSPVVSTVGFGHMGDGNLHLNVATRGYFKEVEKSLEPFVYEWIKGVDGSISAEHGLGFAKKEFIGYSRDETAQKMMKDIKKLYDPNAILNPYKYI